MKDPICQECRTWHESQDPTGWLMSEKYDGICMVRPAGQRRVFSREGIQFNAPDFWLDQLPQNIFLHGEAWHGYGFFRLTQKCLQTPEPNEHLWSIMDLRLIHPQLPTPASGARIGVAFPIEQTVCLGRKHLKFFLEIVRYNRGEGVVLRHRKQPYHLGRSPYLLKIAPTQKELNAMRMPLSECLRRVGLKASTSPGL